MNIKQLVKLIFSEIKKNTDIAIDVSTDIMRKSDYATSDTSGVVDKALIAKNLEGETQLDPLMYRGTDSTGNIGYFHFPVGIGSGSGNISQKVLLDAKTDEMKLISTNDTDKAIIQAYKYETGDNDVISTLKEFNNSESDSFCYDKDKVEFNDGMRIKTNYTIHTQPVSDYFISDEIDKSQFISIMDMR